MNVVSGWFKGEFTALGEPWLEHDERYRRSEEFIRVLRGSWTEDHFSFSGDFYRIHGYNLKPKPLRKPHPEIFQGGTSRGARDMAARVSDWYFCNGNTVDGIKAQVDDIRTKTADAGRPRGMTVLENVELGSDFRGRATFLEQAFRLGRARREERRSRDEAREILALLEIADHRSEIVGRLPYGLQKRVELGRALAPRPKLLLLDEPMAGMSFDEKRDMCRFIIHAHETLGTTLVLIEHHLGVVMDLSDHVIVLDHGRKIADGTAEAVRKDPAVIEAYIGNFVD